MRFELKPMSFGEILDGAVKVFRSNLVLFLTIGALFVYLPVLLLEGGTADNALTRSKVLVMGKNGKGRLDQVLGATLVFGLLGWLLALGLGTLIPAALNGTLLGTFLKAIPHIIIRPLLPISLVLIYFDARVRASVPVPTGPA